MTEIIKCRSCEHCRKLYRLYRYMLFHNNLYYCNLLNNYTLPGDTCENVQKNKHLCDFSEQRFDAIENDIKYLINHLK